MTTTRLILLLLLVAGSAALTIAIAVLAVKTGNWDTHVAMTLLPLVMLGSIALRALLEHRQIRKRDRVDRSRSDRNAD